MIITIITIYIEWCLYHCLKQPPAIFLHEKQAENTNWKTCITFL